MKSTTNVFLDGLITDRHPLSTPQNCLTDALNATLITYNGNEMMLLNDMGNTRILDSATGNVMSLSPGFIPTGIKEHGGIMYITSINKEGKGEIGTIPSPIIRNLYKDKLTILYTGIELDHTTDAVEITNKVYPADKIMINLDMTVDTSDIVGLVLNNTDKKVVSGSVDPCDVLVKRTCLVKNVDLLNTQSFTSPIISYSPNHNSGQDINLEKGIYKIKLSSKSISGTIIEAGESLYSACPDENYWFYHDNNTVFPNDLFEATLSNNLKSVPTSTKPGYLQINLLKELINNFGMIQRCMSPHETPYTIKVIPSNSDLLNVTYQVYFPGFYYSTDSGIYVDSIQCTLFNEKTRQFVNLQQCGSENSYQEIAINFSDALPSTDNYTPINVMGFDKVTESDIYTQIISQNDQKLYPLFYNESEIEGQFFLTNLLDGITSRSNFKSATLIKDNADIPYSGLFRAVLSETEYTQWHQLRVVYKDLYGNELGTYKCRFNPELNDVFGTNAGISSADFAEMKLLGKDYKTIQDTLTLNLVSLNPCKSLDYCSTPWDPEKRSFMFEYTKGTMNFGHSERCTFKRKLDGVILYKYEGAFDADSYRMLPQHKYMYRNLNNTSILGKLDSEWYESVYINPTKEAIKFGFGFNESNGFIDKDASKDLNFIYKKEKDYTISHEGIYNHDDSLLLDYISIDGLCPPYYFRNDEYKYMADTVLLLTTTYEYGSELLNWVVPISRNIESPPTHHVASDKTKEITVPYNLKTTINENNNAYAYTYELTDTPDHYDVFVGVVKKWRSNNSTSELFSNPYLWAIGATDGVNENNVFRIKIPITVPDKLEKTFEYSELKPLYKICPYFVLKNEDKYISKLHLTDNIEYECNLELDGGIPKNYLNGGQQFSQEEGTTASTYSDFSYKKIQKSAAIIDIELLKGIYVFNMSAPYAVSPVNAEHIPVLEVSCPPSGYVKRHDICRVAGSTQSRYGFGTEIYGKHMWHYWPVVVVAKEVTTVNFNLLIDAGWYAYYQDVGLYKLDGDLDLNIFEDVSNSSIVSFTLPEYQQMIIDHTYSMSDSEATSFKQRYCVFLRLAYSYLEGLYNTNHEVEQIKFWKKGYPIGAYTPPEPYIVNFIWDKSNTLWESFHASAMCLYCLPVSVLDNRAQSTFLFFPRASYTIENNDNSTPKYEGIVVTPRSKVGSIYDGSNVEHEGHLTYRVLSTIFNTSNKATSCDPGRWTKLIKKNE